MAVTYSLAITGALVDNDFATSNVDIPDTAATAGGLAGAMASGTQVLCKFTDGSQAWCTFDPRSTFANPILVRVK